VSNAGGVKSNILLYLGNDTKQGHSYYGMPIGTHVIYRMVLFPEVVE